MAKNSNVQNNQNLPHEAVQLLELMFRPGETVCASPNKYGYHSLPLENLMSHEVSLLSTAFRDGSSVEDSIKVVPANTLNLVALNPINGWRNDDSCYRYRNFLIEMDYGTQKQQLEYIENFAVPYSAIIFSGNKSLHFLISLNEDLKDEDEYRELSGWLLNVITLADQNTKNPSRSIRLPGVIREGDKMQTLIALKGPVKKQDLLSWLGKYPSCRPIQHERREPLNGGAAPERLSAWVKKGMTEGFDFRRGRNQTWFSIACDFAISGFSEEEAEDCLRDHFSPERDFKLNEWRASIKSAFKFIYKKTG